MNKKERKRRMHGQKIRESVGGGFPGGGKNDGSFRLQIVTG